MNARFEQVDTIFHTGSDSVDRDTIDDGNHQNDKNINTDVSKQHHPGHKFAYLEEVKNYRVPLTSIPKGGLCQIKELGLNLMDPSENLLENRERYAKTALLLFYPLRTLDDIQINGSYWKSLTFLGVHVLE